MRGSYFPHCPYSKPCRALHEKPKITSFPCVGIAPFAKNDKPLLCVYLEIKSLLHLNRYIFNCMLISLILKLSSIYLLAEYLTVI